MSYFKTSVKACSDNKLENLWLEVEGDIDVDKHKRLNIEYLNNKA